MSFIKAKDLGAKVLADYNAAMDAQDKIKQGVTVIDVVVRHEKEIQELKQRITPTMEFKRREWVGLTDEEVSKYFEERWTGYSGYFSCFEEVMKWAEAKLKEKNGG
jgi:hypothetical protein